MKFTREDLPTKGIRVKLKNRRVMCARIKDGYWFWLFVNLIDGKRRTQRLILSDEAVGAMYHLMIKLKTRP